LIGLLVYVLDNIDRQTVSHIENQVLTHPKYRTAIQKVIAFERGERRRPTSIVRGYLRLSAHGHDSSRKLFSDVCKAVCNGSVPISALGPRLAEVATAMKLTSEDVLYTYKINGLE